VATQAQAASDSELANVVSTLPIEVGGPAGFGFIRLGLIPIAKTLSREGVGISSSFERLSYDNHDDQGLQTIFLFWSRNCQYIQKDGWVAGSCME
jgi:hypothetical protein